MPGCKRFIPALLPAVMLSENEAKMRGITFEVMRFNLKDLDRVTVDEAAHDFVKVLTVLGKDCIPGVTIVGAHASDLQVDFA